jgi:hypothetical protein
MREYRELSKNAWGIHAVGMIIFTRLYPLFMGIIAREKNTAILTFNS